MANRLKITLTKSPIGYKHDQRETVHGLGLRKMWSSVIKEDTPSIRGMVNKVRHLVTVEPVADEEEGAEKGSEADTKADTEADTEADTKGGDEA